MNTQIFEDTNIFQQIKIKCPKKKVVSLCNKLIKKNSYKSGKDCETLCHLCYWLYIYDEPALALECIKPTHGIDFFSDYNVWTFIHAMWGLEIKIFQENGEPTHASKIANTIDEHYLTPTPLMDTPEKIAAHEIKRRSRFTYESVIREDKITPHLESGKLNSANDWRFIALIGMVGHTETGLFPHLNERKNDIDIKTAEYITELKKVK